MIHYLDHAASTPMRPSAIDEMLRVMREVPGNPSGSHRVARAANRVVDEARDVIGTMLGVAPGDVVFTSGGTEADNLAVGGVGGRVACSAVEHPAVLAAVAHLDGAVFGVTADGLVDDESLRSALSADTSLVSVMLANNETGIIQPLDKIAAVVRDAAPRARLHTDAVQAAPWLDLGVLAADADLVSISAHKFGGPKGVGAVGLRNGVTLAAQARGGSQERDRRGGTHNVAGIAGLRVAAEELLATREAESARIRALRDRLLDGLVATIPGCFETGPRTLKTPNIAHVCFDGVESEALLFLLERADIMATAASSCASGAIEPSHVLAAMGVERERALGSLRLSLGHTSTDDDVEACLAVLPQAINQLRTRGSL
ncbi:MAG: cysteine desulfurase family protein [Acidimicrobiales bacterium]